jgi:hypothetical protein
MAVLGATREARSWADGLGLYTMWSFTLAHGMYNGNREQQFPTNVFPVSWQWECAAPCDCSPTQLAYFSELTPEAQRFRENIRQYNAALAFTSLGVKVDSAINAGGGGPPTFRIHGKLCHQLGSLHSRV